MDFKGKKVLVVGLARSGMAAIKVLNTLGATITLSESKKKEDIKELHGVVMATICSKGIQSLKVERILLLILFM